MGKAPGALAEKGHHASRRGPSRGEITTLPPTQHNTTRPLTYLTSAATADNTRPPTPHRDSLGKGSLKLNDGMSATLSNIRMKSPPVVYGIPVGFAYMTACLLSSIDV